MAAASDGTNTTTTESSAEIPAVPKPKLAPILFIKVDAKFKDPKKLEAELAKLTSAKFEYVRFTSSQNVLIYPLNEYDIMTLLETKEIFPHSKTINLQTKIDNSFNIIIQDMPIDLAENLSEELSKQGIIRFSELGKTYRSKNSIKAYVHDKEKLKFLMENHLKILCTKYKIVEFKAPITVMQCYRCQAFGHMTTDCKNDQKCLRCGQNHRHIECKAEKLLCANCGGEHTSNNSICERYQAILVTKMEKIEKSRILRSQKSRAKAIVSQRLGTPSARPTFSSTKFNWPSLPTQQTPKEDNSSLILAAIQSIKKEIKQDIEKLREDVNIVNETTLKSIETSLASTNDELKGLGSKFCQFQNITN
jgi:hypothetical protein